ncbi:zinc finger protein 862-like [Ruditapes philippinarum]|uniref:zinc finger protein 862-like n=1 Tax=Ruditapes philippinarum TaxID=129788 RepID=UPI00295BEBE7|nr:zinc finger protein 862-like [Ruditapes philippinarum]
MEKMSSAPKQRRLTNFFTQNTQNIVVHDQKEESDKKNVENDPNPPKEKKSITKVKVDREFRKEWLTKYPWLLYESNKMTCNICISEGKDNPFTSGCTNFRHSTLVRHLSSNQHRAAVEATSLRRSMSKQTSSIISKHYEAATGVMRSVYWLAKEQLPTSKHKSLLQLQKLQGCNFVDDLQVGTATYCSDSAAEEMQDAMASVLQDSLDDKLSSSPFVSKMLDESCDISVKKKLLLYAKSVNENFDIETHFVDNVQIPDGTADIIFKNVQSILDRHNVKFKNVLAVGSDGASVMTGSKNGFVALVKRKVSPYVIGVHCMAHRLALCTSQAADKVAYLKDYQKILSDIFYHFKRSALRREKVKEIQVLLEEPQLQYKELHSVRWFSMYAALEAVYRTWGSLATYFESEMESKNDSVAKGFFKKITTFTFIACTYLLMDIIPKVTQLSMFLQKDNLDLAMIRPTVESVVQQLTWLKINDGTHLSNLMSVASPEKLTEFKGVRVTDTPVFRQQFKKIRTQFLNCLIIEIERRFPAEATDIISNMAVLCPRGLSLLSLEDRKEYGASQMQTLVSYYGTCNSDTGVEPFIDGTEALLEWEKCKDLIVQQRYPCHTLQSIWKLLSVQHPGAFPNLVKLAMVAVLAPLQTATVERGFSVQNNIKGSGRNRLSSDRLNVLMRISLGPNIENFEFAKAVNKWKESKERRLFSGKK